MICIGQVINLQSLLFLFLQLLSDLGFDGSPVYLTHLLCSPLQLLIVFLFSDALQVLLAEGNHCIKMGLVVTSQFEGTLPTVTVDVHADSTIVVLVLHIDLLCLGVLVEKQS